MLQYNSLAQDIESDDRHYRPLLDRRQQSDFEREAPNVRCHFYLNGI